MGILKLCLPVQGNIKMTIVGQKYDNTLSGRIRTILKFVSILLTLV